jgi:hypothetical protein
MFGFRRFNHGEGWFFIPCAVLFVFLSTGASQGQVTVGVSPFSPNPSDGSIWIQERFGNAQTVISGLGQVISVPAGNPVLNSFNVYAGSLNGGQAGLNAYLVQWSGAAPVGDILWASSAPIIYNPGNNVSTLVTFNTGNLILNPANQYLIVYTYVAGLPDSATIGYVEQLYAQQTQMLYTGGMEQTLAGGTCYVDNAYGYPTDLDFTATFSPNNTATDTPTMPLWGLTVLAVLLAGLAGKSMPRQSAL